MKHAFWPWKTCKIWKACVAKTSVCNKRASFVTKFLFSGIFDMKVFILANKRADDEARGKREFLSRSKTSAGNADAIFISTVSKPLIVYIWEQKLLNRLSQFGSNRGVEPIARPTTVPARSQMVRTKLHDHLDRYRSSSVYYRPRFVVKYVCRKKLRRVAILASQIFNWFSYQWFALLRWREVLRILKNWIIKQP